MGTKDKVVKLERRAVSGLKSAAKTTGKLAKENPAAAAGVLLGAGVVVGAIAHAVLGHKPTARETMMDALRASARRVSKR
ncbi:MAG: hypothetical protein Q8L48_08700 [Archangium sp.]|nr:hypothetical protein [Archangium sp.]